MVWTTHRVKCVGCVCSIVQLHVLLNTPFDFSFVFHPLPPHTAIPPTLSLHSVATEAYKNIQKATVRDWEEAWLHIPQLTCLQSNLLHHKSWMSLIACILAFVGFVFVIHHNKWVSLVTVKSTEEIQCVYIYCKIRIIGTHTKIGAYKNIQKATVGRLRRSPAANTNIQKATVRDWEEAWLHISQMAPHIKRNHYQQMKVDLLFEHNSYVTFASVYNFQLSNLPKSL